MTSMTGTVQEIAAEAGQYFETAKRDNGDYFIRTKDGTPDWVRDLIRAGHGEDFLPDDWRYKTIMHALEYIADTEGDPLDGGGEFADTWGVDTYTSDRIAWLGSNLNRIGYCDEAAEEFGPNETSGDGIIGQIGLGQYVEALEVYNLVYDALEGIAAEREP